MWDPNQSLEALSVVFLCGPAGALIVLCLLSVISVDCGHCLDSPASPPGLDRSGSSYLPYLGHYIVIHTGIHRKT